MKKTVVGMLTMTAMAFAVGSAFAQDAAKAPELTAAEKEQAKKIYFERCAGCHGVLRKGATGKNLEPHWSKKDKDGNVTEGGTLKLGQSRLEKIIGYGTDGGMVNFDDILTKEEIALMSKYIQNTPDVPPEYSLKDQLDSWKVIVPVDQRPTKQMNKINLKNVFSVTLRDTGEVALINGDTKEIVNIVKTGYAVHISRLSASGRYVYMIGRDGRLSLINLWMEKPAVPRARLELAHLSAADFESAASTDSAIGANGGRIIPESLLWFKRLGAWEGFRERGSDQRGRTAFRIRRLPVEVGEDRAHQTVGEIGALGQTEGVELHPHRFGQKVADRITVDKAFDVSDAACSPGSLIDIRAGGVGREGAFSGQAVVAQFLAGIGKCREGEKGSEKQQPLHVRSNQSSLACRLTTLPTTISAGGLIPVSSMRCGKVPSVASRVCWSGNVPLRITAAGVDAGSP